ncbi:hypothetical protein HDU97_002800 [Phlyctochytrium planicorne]|nr:hypothetical protein HDU97_002800 [Phlyctochytrium planicorne]
MKISDFLKARHGKISSELVTNAVCDFMSKIIEIVVAWKGDVIRFLGDAIIVVWQQDSAKQRCIEMALLCCFTILRDSPYMEFDATEIIHAISTRKGQYASGSRPDKIGTIKNRLDLHMAVTFGNVENVVLGNLQQRMDYIVAGPCLNDIGSLLTEASQGNIAIDAECWNCFLSGQVLQGAPASRNMQKTASTPGYIVKIETAIDILNSSLQKQLVPCSVSADEEFETARLPIRDPLLLKFINASIVASFGSQMLQEPSYNGSKSEGGQFRQISIVFVKLLQPFNASMAQAAMLKFLTVLEHHGGVFQQYAVDDKGQTMLACFGLPPWTHSSEASCALRASLEFRDIFSECPFSLAVTSGVILFTTLGNHMRSEASLLGDVVNQAARLLGIASTQFPVVCDSATISTAQGFISTSLGFFHLKGIENDVEVHHVESGTKPPAQTANLFGYKPERMKMLSELDSWQSKESNPVIVIEGPSGIGKSALQTFFVNECKSRNLTTCIARISKESQLIPFSSCRELVLFAMNEAMPLYQEMYGKHLQSSSSVAINDEEKIRLISVLKSMLGLLNEDVDYYPAFAPIFPNVPLGDTALTKKMPERAMKFYTETFVTRLLKGWFRRVSIVLVMDDIQVGQYPSRRVTSRKWMDTASQKIVNHLVEFSKEEENVAGHLFLLLGCRPRSEIQSNQLDVILSASDLTHIVLSGFRKRDVEDYLRLAFGLEDKDGIEPSALNALLSKTSTSPILLQTTVEVLQQNNCFEVKESVLRFSAQKIEFVNEFLEKSLSQAIMTQFDHLSFEFQSLLRYASIAGQYFQIEVVSDLLQRSMDSKQMKSFIEKEDKFTFLQEDKGGGFFFRHISIAIAIYESIPFSEQIALHIKFAKFLETQLSENVHSRTTILPSLYYHYWRSNHLDSKISFAEELGLYYSRIGYYEESVTILNPLVKFVESLPEDTLAAKFKSKIRKASWYSTLADAASLTDHYDDCLVASMKTVNDCCAILIRDSRPALWVYSASTAAYALSSTRPKDSKKYLESAFQLANEKGIEIQGRMVFACITSVFIYDGEGQEATEMLLQFME